jgi:hypothetical protein
MIDIGDSANRPVSTRSALFAAALFAAVITAPQATAAAAAPPTPADWAALATLPDWTGIWIPHVPDQKAKEKTDLPPWTPAVQKQIDFLFAEEAAGRPKLILAHCLPHGMPSWMLMTHNAMEILYTPGRITMLGEGDGNRMRRIYTDGRKHPEDPDLTIHGHSIGHWEGDTLVVDTVGIIPQSYIAVSEAVGVPNNGDIHVTERIRLAAPDTMHVELEITAPKVMTKPWKTTRIFLRRRGPVYDIVEGQCMQGQLDPAVDKDGNMIFQHVPPAADGALPVSPQ